MGGAILQSGVRQQIGRAVRVATGCAACTAAVTTITGSDEIMTYHSGTAMGGGARHGCDPPHGAAAIGADEDVTDLALSIAFGVTGRQLGIGRSVMGIEQPAAEGDVVAASAVGEKAVVANAMEAVREGMQQETADVASG